MANKENDWFLAISENPDFQISNFMQVGLTPENTQLKDKSFYQNSQYIQNLYQQDGKFDQAAFDEAYNKAASEFQTFSNNSFKDQLLSDYQYDMYDSTRPIGATIKKPNIQIQKVANPLRQVVGFGGIDNISVPTTTIEESAQQSKIYDWKNQQFTDYTPNDQTLENSAVKFIKSLFEPLVLAQWDDDGEHIDLMSGSKKQHKKGELKTNEDGDYYYETLGDRSPYGKQIKSAFDSITVDGSSLNRYDFFDADGLDKSVTGTLAKTMVAITPLFTPLAPYYGYAMIGTQLMDLLPTMYNTIAGNFTDQSNPFFNQLQGFSRSLRGNTSQYSKENMMTFENFANTVMDVALQWQQQRTLFDLYHKATGTNSLIKAVEKESALLKPVNFGEQVEQQLGMQIQAAQGLVSANKLKPLLDARNRMAANASLGYMAALQAFDVYEDTLSQGASKTEAAAMAWGAALGMYTVDRTGIGELFFPELQSDVKAYQSAIKKLRDSIASGYTTIGVTEKGTSKGLFKLMDKARNASSNYWQNVKNHSLGFLGKSFGEGIEEVLEELVVDFTKSTYNLLHDLGLTNGENKLDAWDNAAQRYGMNFFGGAVGGAIFYGVDLVQGRLNEQTNQELVYLLRNGKKQEILNELTKMRNAGKLGSTTLSASKWDTSQDTIKWLTAEDETDSQNNRIAQQITDVIQSIDNAIHQESINYSDPEIIDKLVMSDLRLLKVIEKVGETGTTARAVRDFNNLSSQIVKKVSEIKKLNKDTNDREESETRGNKSEHEQYETQLSTLQSKLNTLRQKRDQFFSEDASNRFTDRLLFEINDFVNKAFYNSTFDQYVEAKTGQTTSELSTDELASLRNKYIKDKQADIYDQFDTAYMIYEYFNKKYTQTVNDSGNSYEEFAKVRNLLWQQLVDIEATAIKAGVAEIGTLDELRMFFAKNPTLQPVLKSEYDPRMDILDDTNMTEEERSAAKERIIQKFVQDSQNKYQKISEIIDRFKQIGFIDYDSRKLLLQALGQVSINSVYNTQEKIDLENKIWNAIQNISIVEDDNNEINDNNLIETFSSLDKRTSFAKSKQYSKLFNELITVINSINGDNIEDVKQKINTIKAELYDILRIDDREDIEPGSAEEDIEILNNTFDALFDIVNELNEELKNSEQYKTINKLKTELSEVRQNPLITFLQQIHTEISGHKSNVIEILDSYNQKLEKEGFANFELDDVQIKEIETALQALQITRSLIYAASSEKLSTERLLGHNAVYNELTGTQKYGIVRSDLAKMMDDDLNWIEKQLLFLKRVSLLNTANTLNAQRKTGQALNKQLYKVFKPHSNYEELREITVSGISLFDGVDDIDVSELEELETNPESDKLGQIAIDQLVNKISANYKRIIDQSALKQLDINNEIVKQLLSKFNISEIVTQKTSNINQKLEYLTPFDVVINVLAAASLSRQEFNEIYSEIIEEVGLVPVPAQEHIIFLAAAFLKNPNLFKAFIESLPSSTDKDNLVKLFNVFLIDGIGGAGKTTILKILRKFSDKFVSGNKEIWAVAPKESQVMQLDGQIKGNRQLTIDQLLKEILSEEDYQDYKAFIQGDKSKTNLFEYGKDEKIVKLLNQNIKFRNLDKVGVIVIDECTHLDNAAALILSQAALKYNFIIFGSGDSFQNGFYLVTEKAHIENINKESVLTIRTNKLDVSMRNQTIQKKKNSEFLTQLSEIEEYEDVNQLKEYINTLFSEKSLLYYEGDDYPLSGEKLQTSLDEAQIRRLLQGKTTENVPVKITYVYDKNSKYKSLFERLQSEFSDRINIVQADKMQGLESDYTIIDVDFSKYDVNQFNDLNLIISQIYTMFTRSKIGSIILDNDLSSKFPNLRFTKEDYAVLTPDISKKLKDLIEERKRLLKESIEKGKQTTTTLPPVRTKVSGNTKEDIVAKCTDLKNKIIASQILSSQRDELNEQVDNIQNTAVNDSEADYDELSNKLSEIEDKLNQFIQNYENVRNRIEALINKIKIAKRFFNVDEFKNFINDAQDRLDKLEEYLQLLNSNTEIQDDKIEEISNFLDNVEQLWQNYQDNYLKGTRESYINSEEENITSDENDVIDGTIRVWGFYDRIGNDNEDAKMFRNLSESNGDLIYHRIRSYFASAENLEDLKKLLKYESSIIRISSIQKFIDELHNALDSGTGTFKLVINKFNRDEDTPNSYIPDFKESDVIIRLVYEFQSTDERIKRITLGALTDPSNWMKNVKDEDKQTAIAYSEYIARLTQECRQNDETIEVPVEFKIGTRFTNFQEISTPYTMDNFKEYNKNTIISPYYVSGSESEGNDTKHRAVVFVTDSDIYIDEDGNVQELNPNNLKQVYIKLKGNKARGALIRKMCLNVDGQFLTDFTEGKETIRGLLNLDLLEILSNETSRKELGKILSTYTTNNTGVRMFMTLWNWRAELRSMLVSGTITKKQSTQRWIKIDNGLNTEVIVSSNVCKFKNEAMAQAWLELLDNILNFITKTIEYASETSSFSKDSYITDPQKAQLHDLFSSCGNIVKIKTDAGEVNLPKDTSTQVIIMLSNLYRFFVDERVRAKEFVVGSDEISSVAEIKKNFKKALEKVPGNGDGKQIIEAITDFINIVFHGRKYPHKEEVNSEKQMRGAMFKYGVLYHPKFAPISGSENESSQKEYYPLSKYNEPKQFKSNVLVQIPNLYIRIPELKEVKTGTIQRVTFPSEEELVKQIAEKLKIPSDSKFFGYIQLSVKRSLLEAQEQQNETINTYSGTLTIDQINKLLSGENVINGSEIIEKRNPLNHLAYILRGALQYYIREHFLDYIESLGTDPTKIFTNIKIQTGNNEHSSSEIKIILSKPLSETIGQDVKIVRLGDFFYYVQNGRIKQVNFNVSLNKQIPNQTTIKISVSQEDILQNASFKGEEQIENMIEQLSTTNPFTRQEALVWDIKQEISNVLDEEQSKVLRKIISIIKCN